MTDPTLKSPEIQVGDYAKILLKKTKHEQKFIMLQILSITGNTVATEKGLFDIGRIYSYVNTSMDKPTRNPLYLYNLIGSTFKETNIKWEYYS